MRRFATALAVGLAALVSATPAKAQDDDFFFDSSGTVNVGVGTRYDVSDALGAHAMSFGFHALVYGGVTAYKTRSMRAVLETIGIQFVNEANTILQTHLLVNEGIEQPVTGIVAGLLASAQERVSAPDSVCVPYSFEFVGAIPEVGCGGADLNFDLPTLVLMPAMAIAGHNLDVKRTLLNGTSIYELPDAGAHAEARYVPGGVFVEEPQGRMEYLAETMQAWNPTSPQQQAWREQVLELVPNNEYVKSLQRLSLAHELIHKRDDLMANAALKGIHPSVQTDIQFGKFRASILPTLYAIAGLDGLFGNDEEWYQLWELGPRAPDDGFFRESVRIEYDNGMIKDITPFSTPETKRF